MKMSSFSFIVLSVFIIASSQALVTMSMGKFMPPALEERLKKGLLTSGELNRAFGPSQRDIEAFNRVKFEVTDKQTYLICFYSVMSCLGRRRSYILTGRSTCGPSRSVQVRVLDSS